MGGRRQVELEVKGKDGGFTMFHITSLWKEKTFSEDRVVRLRRVSYLSEITVNFFYH